MIRNAPVVHGHIAPGFEPVFDAFVDNFRQRGERGAAVSVRQGDEVLVDLWAGSADPRGDRPWREHTLAVLFSATKGLVATAFAMLEDRGQLDLDAPVARWWPELRAAREHPLTTRHILGHTSGLVTLDRPIDLDDLQGWSDGGAPQAVIEALEAQRPRWVPGAAQGYHAVTYGLYAGELFHRVTGERLSPWLRAHVAGPLGLDLHLGLAAAHHHRVAPPIPVGRRGLLTRIVPTALASRSADGRIYRQFLAWGSDTRAAFATPAELGVKGVRNFATPRVWAMALPWASATGGARDLAGLYAALARGSAGGLVSDAAVARVAARQSWSWDRTLRKPMGFSQGFVKEETRLYSPNPAAFGHPGAGGILGFADPDAGFGFGYVMNRMDHRLRSPRALALARAVYRCLR